ncbi:MAG: hypothetical protein IJ493_05080 [Clostridia bacterium]|nr:hypothetical protein [Clostridia bacterium]
MEGGFVTILNMSIAASWVILAILAVRLALARAPKKFSYWLWIAAGFRLCCPVGVKLPFSLFNLLRTDDMTFVPADLGMMAEPQVSTGSLAADSLINPLLPAATPQYSANPMQIWLFAGAIIWIAGAAAILLYGVISYGLTAYRMRTAVKLEGNVWQSDRVRSPFVMGIWKPRIFVPFGLNDETMRYVLAHERFHIRHGDHAVRLFSYGLLALHWFNPLCWLAYRLMGWDMELRCDEAVLASGESRTAYSETLLALAANSRRFMPGLSGFGETGVRARIKNALRWREPKRWVNAAAAVAVVAVVTACASDPAVEALETLDSCFVHIEGRSFTAQAAKDFNFDYDKLPDLIVDGEGTLVINVSVSGDTLTVGEDYYQALGTNGTTIKRETFTLNRDDDGLFRLPVKRRGTSSEDEYAVYYIVGDDGKYSVRVLFPAS